MGRKRKVKSNEETWKSSLPPCRVCGAPGNGIHYGVTTCEACKGFFYRSFQYNMTYLCQWNQQCTIDHRKYRLCKMCRYNKCLAVGMSKTAIKIGRYSSKQKTLNHTETNITKSCENQIEPESENHVSDYANSYKHNSPRANYQGEPYSSNFVYHNVNQSFERMCEGTSWNWHAPSQQESYRSSDCHGGFHWDDESRRLNTTPQRMGNTCTVSQTSEGEFSPPGLDSRTRLSLQGDFRPEYHQEELLRPTPSLAQMKPETNNVEGLSDMPGMFAARGPPFRTPEAETSTAALLSYEEEEEDKPTDLSRSTTSSSPPFPSDSLRLRQSPSCYDPPHSSASASPSPCQYMSPEPEAGCSSYYTPPSPSPCPSQTRYSVQSPLVTSSQQASSVASDTRPTPLRPSPAGPDDVPEDDIIADLYKDNEQILRILEKANADYLEPLFADVTGERFELERRKHREICQLQRQMFGSLSHLDDQEYDEIFSNTGLDADGRQDNLADFPKSMERFVRAMINFAKVIPGFSRLDVGEQFNLIKHSREDFCHFSTFNFVDCDTGVSLCLDKRFRCPHDMMRSGFSCKATQDMYKHRYFSFCRRLQKLELTDSEQIFLKAMVIMSPDRDYGVLSPTAQEIHWQLTQHLIDLLTKRFPWPLARFAKILDCLVEVRSRTADHIRCFSKLNIQKYTSVMHHTLLRDVLSGIFFPADLEESTMPD